MVNGAFKIGGDLRLDMCLHGYQSHASHSGISRTHTLAVRGVIGEVANNAGLISQTAHQTG